MFKKFWVVLAVLLVAGLVVAGAVLAQSPTPNRPDSFVDEDGDGLCDLCGQAGRGRGGRGMMGLGGRWDGVTLVGTIAEALDMTVAEVRAEVAEGKTLRQVIVAHEGDPEAIVNAFVAARKAVLDKLVAEGKLTQEQAEQMLANIKAEALRHLDEANPTNGRGAGGCGSGARRMGMRGGRGAGRWGAQPEAS
jgi:hypothetical protein